MNSIKEKAEEYQETALKEKGAILRVDVRNAFQAGANYVLDEIEKLTNHQNWCAFPKQSHKELKELIDQLKENNLI